MNIFSTSTLVEMLGGNKGPTFWSFRWIYVEERRMHGVTWDQVLADGTSSRLPAPARNLSQMDVTAQRALDDGAFAVTPRQAWRGTRFRPPRGHKNMYKLTTP